MAVTGAVRHGHGRFTAAFGIGPKSKFFEVPFFAGQQNIYLENSGSLRAKLFVETGNHKEPHLHEKNQVFAACSAFSSTLSRVKGYLIRVGPKPKS